MVVGGRRAEPVGWMVCDNFAYSVADRLFASQDVRWWKVCRSYTTPTHDSILRM